MNRTPCRTFSVALCVLCCACSSGSSDKTTPTDHPTTGDDTDAPLHTGLTHHSAERPPHSGSSAAHTGGHSAIVGPYRGDELMFMLTFGEVELVGGVVSTATIGAYLYTANWTGDFADTTESCVLRVEAGPSTSGVLDSRPTVPPVIEVPRSSPFTENCHRYFGTDPTKAAALLPRSTAFAMSSVIDGDIQSTIDAFGYDDTVLATQWYLPILKPSAHPTGVGGTGPVDGARIRTDLVVPDGSYLVWGPLILIEGYFDGVY